MNFLRGRLLKQFANKLGLVYFGRVDQHRDEHDVIRGLTVSTSHKDNHYVVGTYDGYDISIVDRSDTIVQPDGKRSRHSWLIIRMDLISDAELPHLFLNPLGHSQDAYGKLFQAFHHLQPVNSMMVGQHSSEFHNRYGLHTMSSRTLEAEHYLTPEVTQGIASRLWPHAVELFENRLYLYSTEEKLSMAELNTTLESGLWLARIFDKQQD